MKIGFSNVVNLTKLENAEFKIKKNNINPVGNIKDIL
tara:strand:- start:1180 stop:1290 length:111 start_codon:yes stop_codon:yes gene_type:complete